MTQTDEARAREIALRNPLMCGVCGGSLPNPDCGQRNNGWEFPTCVPAGNSSLEAEIEAALKQARREGAEQMRAAARDMLLKRADEYKDAPGYGVDRGVTRANADAVGNLPLPGDPT